MTVFKGGAMTHKTTSARIQPTKSGSHWRETNWPKRSNMVTRQDSRANGLAGFQGCPDTLRTVRTRRGHRDKPQHSRSRPAPQVGTRNTINRIVKSKADLTTR